MSSTAINELRKRQASKAASKSGIAATGGVRAAAKAASVAKKKEISKATAEPEVFEGTFKELVGKLKPPIRLFISPEEGVKVRSDVVYGWGTKFFSEGKLVTALPYGDSVRVTAGNEYRIPFTTIVKAVKVPKEELYSSDEYVQGTIKQSRYHNFVGADPEVFAVDKNGVVIPAWTFLKSKKVDSGVYWDGFQAEFSPHSAMCMDGFKQHIYDRLHILREKLPKGAKLSLKNTFYIPYESIEKALDEHVAFGCTPSLNAYNEKSPLLGVSGRETNLRSSGGHLHFTLAKPNDKDYIRNVVKMMDRILGVFSVSMFQHWDSPDRRRLYGRAGEYRTPSYGVEYRVLSNAWLCDPLVYHLVYEIARRCIGMSTEFATREWKATEEEIRECINTCNVELAHKIIQEDPIYRQVINSMPTDPSTVENGWPVWEKYIMGGVHQLFADPDTLDVSRWHDSVYRAVRHSSDSIKYLLKLKDREGAKA